jgi:prolyl-tRNA synthetase
MVAPAHVVVQPVLHKPETAAEVRAFCDTLVADLRKKHYGGRAVEVELDARDIRGGDKTWQWVKRGAPVRVEVGPRDVASGSVFVGRRDKGVKEKESMPVGTFVEGIESMLAEIQQGLFDRAKAFRTEHTRTIDSKDDFYDFFKSPGKGGEDEGAAAPIHGGFALAHFNGDPALEEKIKQDLAVTVRCIPLDGQGLCGDEGEPGVCPFTGEKSAKRVVWAKSY